MLLILLAKMCCFLNKSNGITFQQKKSKPLYVELKLWWFGHKTDQNSVSSQAFVSL